MSYMTSMTSYFPYIHQVVQQIYNSLWRSPHLFTASTCHWITC